MNSTVWLVISAALLSLYQAAAMLPWLAALDVDLFRSAKRRADLLRVVGGTFAGLLVVIGIALKYTNDGPRLEFFGRLYGCVLHIQLIVDFFVLAFFALLKLWPKGGAVALAAFRESVRQPLYWLIVFLTMFGLVVSMILPYFTLGDEFKMMSNISYDMIMLAAALFGVLAASISIHEEIEGRTAITLMSKPVTRRHFLIGKFVGILLACWALTCLLAWTMNWTMYVKPSLEKLDDSTDPLAVMMQNELQPVAQRVAFGYEGQSFARGSVNWLGETLIRHGGLLLGFGQVTILLAIACALATRLPFAVNVVLLLMVYFLGHLAPVLVRFSAGQSGDGAGPRRLPGPSLRRGAAGAGVLQHGPGDHPHVRFAARRFRDLRRQSVPAWRSASWDRRQPTPGTPSAG